MTIPVLILMPDGTRWLTVDLMTDEELEERYNHWTYQPVPLPVAQEILRSIHQEKKRRSTVKHNIEQVGSCTGIPSLTTKDTTLTTKDTNPKDAVGVRKPYLSTVPCPVLFEVGAALLEGACKYRRHNYRVAGVRMSVYYDATMRHLMAWWEGEDVDPDSGLNHVTKAIASLVVLRDAMMQGKVTDDRPPSARPWKFDADVSVNKILEKYPNPLPPCTWADVPKEGE